LILIYTPSILGFPRLSPPYRETLPRTRRPRPNTALVAADPRRNTHARHGRVLWTDKLRSMRHARRAPHPRRLESVGIPARHGSRNPGQYIITLAPSAVNHDSSSSPPTLPALQHLPPPSHSRHPVRTAFTLPRNATC
jgi:hypothetical protein